MSAQMNRSLSSPASLLALAGLGLGILAPAALAVPMLSGNYPNVPSYKLAGNAGNTSRVIPFGAINGNVRKISISGTLSRTTTSTFPREAALRFTRLVNVAPNISIRTHTFIAQPFTATNWDANGTATIPEGTFVLPVPESLNFAGGFNTSSLAEPGSWQVEFFEQYDDNAADASSTPDAMWSNITITFDDEAPSMDTPAVETGNMASRTFYGARSDDTLAVGTFTGSTLSNLNTPVGDRIRHVRVSGYLTNLIAYTASPGVSAPQTSQARIRLVRSESVLLSPNDPQAFNTTDELFVTVPANIPSSGWVSIDIPVGPNDDFAKLTRNVPNPDGSSYFGINYFANCYEVTDDAQAPDSVWNALKFEFFTDAQPGSTASDFGLLQAAVPGVESVETLVATIPAGQPKWFRFEMPVGVDASSAGYLDIDTENTSPLFDTVIAVYSGHGANAGQRLAADDDDASGNLSSLTFGSTTARPAIGTGVARNGRDGGLEAGVYYIAAVPYIASVGVNAFGPNSFNVTNSDTADHPVRMNVRFNVPVPPSACSLADIVGGGAGGDEPDGTVDGSDFIAFVNSFAIGDASIDPKADVAGGGNDGLSPDGTIDGSDFIAFINAFAIGC
jgi:hypothetical protein